MQYVIEHADELIKLLKVKAQVSEVQSIMLENVEKVPGFPRSHLFDLSVAAIIWSTNLRRFNE